ncbi:MAG: CRISPR-associated helicase Cas3' [Alicyclobacillus sp.]|nr:CRISPR-associated helicase Cas3' [Alicyclobacillus sp.]
MEFYAHSRDDGQYQPLKEHLTNVASLCLAFADVFGAGYLGYLAGILHDVGKYSAEFQRRVRGESIRVDHSSAGAQWIVRPDVARHLLGKTRFDFHFAVMVAHAIAGHHGGLQNYGTMDEEGSLKNRLEKQGIPDWHEAWKELQVQPDDWGPQRTRLTRYWTSERLAWSYSFLGRMLYSCLVDADSIDTRNYCSGLDPDLRLDAVPSISGLMDRFQTYLDTRFSSVPDTDINRMRERIRETCERRAALSPGMFSLTVPTGGGKTLSSLAFALRHATQHGMRRVIYVIPFTSIIEQNARVFRQALGPDAVLEHHSNFNYEEYGENYGPDEAARLKLSAENWDTPVVVTTSVQFFESLFSNKRSQCRKLHNIARSVIIVDEAQSIPRGYISPCLQALNELVSNYGCTAVLCTATQPAWRGLGVMPTEIMDSPTPDELVRTFERVSVSVHGDSSHVTRDEQVAGWIASAEQVLCIVNTRKHAQSLFAILKSLEVEDVYHLSGRLCAKHRSDVISKIRQRLAARLPCRVVSTQLIEAGVDVDFPLVLRAYAGLDSIAQAAGRCNREGRLQRGEVMVFYPESHGMPSAGWMKETAVEAQNTLAYSPGSPLSPSALRDYFERLHGIRTGRVDSVTDCAGLLPLLRSKSRNLEIPYEEVSERFRLIDENMWSIVIPYDDLVTNLVKELASSPYPLRVLRKLQPYVVQVYHPEFMEFGRLGLIRSLGGVALLVDKAYYDKSQLGLLSAADVPEMEDLIF